MRAILGEMLNRWKASKRTPNGIVGADRRSERRSVAGEPRMTNGSQVRSKSGIQFKRTTELATHSDRAVVKHAHIPRQIHLRNGKGRQASVGPKYVDPTRACSESPVDGPRKLVATRPSGVIPTPSQIAPGPKYVSTRVPLAAYCWIMSGMELLTKMSPFWNGAAGAQPGQAEKAVATSMNIPARCVRLIRHHLNNACYESGEFLKTVQPGYKLIFHSFNVATFHFDDSLSGQASLRAMRKVNIRHQIAIASVTVFSLLAFLTDSALPNGESPAEHRSLGYRTAWRRRKDSRSRQR